MPYYNLKRIWTPLEFVGVKIYKDQESNKYFRKNRTGQYKSVGSPPRRNDS
ncbi:hypothetical protein SAMN05518684_107148 [Salipaludibacillus aurantiacus]|uniref:Uncharacterized protein n=1 Tax=Salipaludibacillus aurantiacus TaxID=1601833 RepID=A0A1H9UED6_9BACI|nr:hypothetical protein SAMN05518684_107148 [Salipaludibacillus aurantiacus]